jgi:hypothetical protein
VELKLDIEATTGVADSGYPERAPGPLRGEGDSLAPRMHSPEYVDGVHSTLEGGEEDR